MCGGIFDLWLCVKQGGEREELVGVVGWARMCFHFLDRVTMVSVSSGLKFRVRVVILVVMRLRDII